MKPSYKKQLAFKPNKGDIFVVFNGYVTRRFDENTESKYDYPKHVDLPDWSEANGTYHRGNGTENLIKYDGKRFRNIR